MRVCQVEVECEGIEEGVGEINWEIIGPVGVVGEINWEVIGPVGVVGDVVYIFGQEKINKLLQSLAERGRWRERGWDLALC